MDKQCWGITKQFKRCKNPRTRLLFCGHHLWQPLTLGISALLFVIALLSDVLGIFEYLSPSPVEKKIDEIYRVVVEKKPENPSIKEVETEIEKELRKAFEKKKAEALKEYRLGNTAYDNNLINVAVSRFEKALKIVEVPSFYLALGNSYFVISKYEPALNNYQTALKLFKDENNQQGEASDLGNIGLIYSDKGDLDNALKYHSDALVIHREIGYKQGEASDLGNIGLIYKNKGDLDNALKYMRQAKVIFEKIGAKPQLSIVQKAIDKIMEQKKP
jgi:tetratricopeptide (TPR) repeat protein